MLIFQSHIIQIKCSLFTLIVTCIVRIGNLYIWYPNKLVFAVAKMPPNPHLHGGIKTLPFWKKATPKTFTYQAPNPRIFGGSLAGRQVEKMVFRQAKRVLLRMCQFLKFSLHGSAKTADPFRCDLPLTHTIFSFLPVRKLLTIFRNAFELGLSPLFRLREWGWGCGG